MSYQTRTDGDWMTAKPVMVMREFLNAYPGAVVTLSNGTQWRKTPRDWELIETITDIVSGPAHSDSDVAEKVYNLLEGRGLV